MGLPRVVITGASGFLGRHLLAVMKDRYRIYALARRSQRRVRAPVHPNISWHQADIGVFEPLSSVFRHIADEGGAEILIHLAAYYDFDGDDNPEYWRTNVEGLRNVLDLSKQLGLARFVFASSLAASRFPHPGHALTEESPVDGELAYAVTKRLGEEMLAEYRSHFPSCVVRLGALFSDWCEYAPLFFFLHTWLSQGWIRRVLAGRGESAVPYLHIRDAVAFFQRLLEIHREFGDREVLIASTDGCVTHRQLFGEATKAHRGKPESPILMPKALCVPGLWARDLLGRVLGERPFERPWMGKYIDLQLRVDGSRTRNRMNWAPNPRFDLVHRMPFLIENYGADPVEWSRRNRAAMKSVRVSRHLRIHQILEANEPRIIEQSIERFLHPRGRSRFASYHQVEPEELRWAVQQTFRNLKNAIRTREKGLFKSYCRDLAERRYRQGFRYEEVCEALTTELELCKEILEADPRSKGLESGIHDYLVMTFRLGIDEVQDVYEEQSGKFLTPEEAVIPQLAGD
jgi:nucleoside-diphosphate-sugar epimerase